MTEDPALAIYAAHAPVMARRYDAVTTDLVLSGLADLIPSPPTPVLDIGAGSGRDTAWFLDRGHAVTAVEPVAAFRAIIAARAATATLIDATLPELKGVCGGFGLILVNAVWHHLSPGAREGAIRRLSDLVARDGRILLALRHGPVPAGVPVHALDMEEETSRAETVGLSVLRRLHMPALDAETAAAGISWTWLALTKEGVR